MPRGARDSLGGFCYHVLHRGNGRRTVFHKKGDCDASVKLLHQAGERVACYPTIFGCRFGPTAMATWAAT